MNRRDFLKTSTLLALAPSVPMFLGRAADASSQGPDRRVLVVVQLDGGNDALNTLIPNADAEYARLRPGLAVPSNQVICVTDSLGLHPSLRPLARLLEAGQLAIIPGVGYPNPSRSHFMGMSIWHTARLERADQATAHGWLGRALDVRGESSYAVHDAIPAALRGRRSRACALGRREEMLLSDPLIAENAVAPGRATAGDGPLAFVRRQALDGYAAADELRSLPRGSATAAYPATGLARRLQLVAGLLKANLGTRVFYTLQAGFDTHAAQRSTHGNLLGEFAGAVASFFADLDAAHLADRVVLLAFSEFGRTIRENSSAGTDHGTAGCVFLAGPSVRGGIRGTMPSLTDLEEGEPVMTTDFRQVYGAVLGDWLGLPRTEDILGGRFTTPGLFTK